MPNNFQLNASSRSRCMKIWACTFRYNPTNHVLCRRHDYSTVKNTILQLGLWIKEKIKNQSLILFPIYSKKDQN